MHIGLIGGIGPAATEYYYRGLIERHTRANTPLELTIVHAIGSIDLASLKEVVNSTIQYDLKSVAGQ